MTPLPSPDGNEYVDLDASLKADALDVSAAANAHLAGARPVRPELDALESEKARRAARETGDLGRQQSAVLEANGYNAIRAQIMANVNALAELPGEAIDAAEAFTHRALTNAKIDPRPEARQAIDAMEAELGIYRVVLELRRSLTDLEKRARARDRILAR